PCLRRVAGCATPTGSAGHASATASLKLTFHLDHSVGANHSQRRREADGIRFNWAPVSSMTHQAIGGKIFCVYPTWIQTPRVTNQIRVTKLMCHETLCARDIQKRHEGKARPVRRGC